MEELVFKLIMVTPTVLTIVGGIYILCKWNKRVDNLKGVITKPVVVTAPVVDDTPRFSPPVYELEQWVRDNWKKIKITELNKDYGQERWKVESEVINCEVFYSHGYYCLNCGLNLEEFSHLCYVYRSILADRKYKLDPIKQERNRKQLARKLQKLGYGEGKYA